MAITKLSNIGTPQGGGAAHLKNCISYILNSDKTEGLVGGNAGTTPQEVYQVMMDTKQEWEKENGRQGYHFVISFPPGEATKEEAYAQFDVSLKQTGAGYFDFYLLHNLGEARTEYFDKFDMWNWVAEKKVAGLIKHVGFSFHSTPEELEAILKEHPEMEFVQLQINYADWENSAIQSRGCYEVARKYDKPVIIMEPVKGGMLATPPESVVKVLKDAEPESSAASWAVRFAANLEGVITVLSGMSNVEQMKDNLSYMKNFNGLNDTQMQTLKRAQEELNKISLIPCTSCNYCAKVCPMQIGISGSFTAMNSLTLYSDKDMALHQENWLVGGHGLKRANECVKCGKCEEACPQHIQIRTELEHVSEELLTKVSKNSPSSTGGR